MGVLKNNIQEVVVINKNWENKYKNMGEYYIGYSPKTKEEFYFDSKYYDVIKNHKWKLTSKKDPVTKINGHDITMTKLLFGDNVFIHVNGNHSDVKEDNIKNIRGYKNNGKTYLNGYVAIYMPEHKRSFSNGCVYEHIIEAERMLGRELKPFECVHHINQDRTDNRHENLMVFATNEDHVAFHGGGNPILTEDGSYITERVHIPYYEYVNRTASDIKNNIEDEGSIRIKEKDLCPFCMKNPKSIDANMCVECYNRKRAEHIPSKEVLNSLIHTKSFVDIGKEYGVKDNSVRRWCKKYGLPYRRKDISNEE